MNAGTVTSKWPVGLSTRRSSRRTRSSPSTCSEHVEDEDGVENAVSERKRERIGARGEREILALRVDGRAVDGDEARARGEHLGFTDGADADSECAVGLADEAFHSALQDRAAGAVPPMLVLERGHFSAKMLLHDKPTSIAQPERSSASVARSVCRSTFVPASIASGREYSLGEWLMPATLGMKIIPTGARRAML